MRYLYPSGLEGAVCGIFGANEKRANNSKQAFEVFKDRSLQVEGIIRSLLAGEYILLHTRSGPWQPEQCGRC